jgi:osmoprotectant transport system permease protein
MITEMVRLLQTRWGFFLELLLEHLQISLISIMLAMIIGLLIGILISEFQKSSKLVIGVVNFIYTIPSISLLGFLIPLSGIGNTTAVIALTVYALLPMVRNTHTGLTNVNPLLLEAATGMGSTRLQVLTKIKLPLAMPIIIAGIRNMAVMTIALAGIASFIGAGGLGVAIYRGITTNNKAMTMVGSLLIAILAIAVDFLIGILEKKVKRHRA